MRDAVGILALQGGEDVNDRQASIAAMLQAWQAKKGVNDLLGTLGVAQAFAHRP